MADAWKAWVESILVNEHSVKCADNSGIYGLDGNPWCQTENYNLSQQEVKDIIAMMDRGSGSSAMMGNLKYIVLRIDNEILVAKANNRGVTVAKAKTCILVGQYEHHGVIQPGNNYNRVVTVKDQLIDHGY